MRSKKIFMLLLVVVMMLAAIPMTNVFAGEYDGTCGENIYWVLDTETCTLTISGTGEMYDYSAEELPEWYDYREYIESVVVENGVTKIGACSFYAPDILQYVGQEPSWYFNLKKVELPETVTEISQAAFLSCQALKSITIPQSVKIIGSMAFSFTSVSQFYIPANVEEIGEQAFFYCFSAEFNVDSDNKYYSSENGILFDKEKTVLIAAPIYTQMSEYEIPGTVKTISDYAFALNYRLTDITIPASVTSVGNMAFIQCEKLNNITFLNPYTEIYDSENTINSSATQIKVFAYNNSTAQEYAEKYGLTFVSLGDYIPPTDEETTTEEATTEEITTEEVSTEENALSLWQRIIEFFKGIFEAIKNFFSGLF